MAKFTVTFSFKNTYFENYLIPSHRFSWYYFFSIMTIVFVLTMSSNLAYGINTSDSVKYDERLSITVISTIENDNSMQQTNSSESIHLVIPDWIRKNSKWWSLTQISDKDFSSGLEYLIRQQIIQIPDSIPSEYGDHEKKLPGWLRKNAGWWSQGLLSDEEFAKSLKWMILHGFIKI